VDGRLFDHRGTWAPGGALCGEGLLSIGDRHVLVIGPRTLSKGETRAVS
jgi:hypothetical protein